MMQHICLKKVGRYIIDRRKRKVAAGGFLPRWKVAEDVDWMKFGVYLRQASRVMQAKSNLTETPIWNSQS